MVSKRLKPFDSCTRHSWARTSRCPDMPQMIYQRCGVCGYWRMWPEQRIVAEMREEARANG